MKSAESAIRQVDEDGARATRKGRHDDVLANDQDDWVVFDVLPPMKYESSAAYRESWDDWQPDPHDSLRCQVCTLPERGRYPEDQGGAEVNPTPCSSGRP